MSERLHMPQNSKYILLDRINADDTQKPAGEMKGLIKTAEQNGTTITIFLESGENLELKVRLESLRIILKIVIKR